MKDTFPNRDTAKATIEKSTIPYENIVRRVTLDNISETALKLHLSEDELRGELEHFAKHNFEIVVKEWEEAGLISKEILQSQEFMDTAQASVIKLTRQFPDMPFMDIYNQEIKNRLDKFFNRKEKSELLAPVIKRELLGAFKVSDLDMQCFFNTVEYFDMEPSVVENVILEQFLEYPEDKFFEHDFLDPGLFDDNYLHQDIYIKMNDLMNNEAISKNRVKVFFNDFLYRRTNKFYDSGDRMLGRVFNSDSNLEEMCLQFTKAFPGILDVKLSEIFTDTEMDNNAFLKSGKHGYYSTIREFIDFCSYKTNKRYLGEIARKQENIWGQLYDNNLQMYNNPILTKGDLFFCDRYKLYPSAVHTTIAYYSKEPLPIPTLSEIFNDPGNENFKDIIFDIFKYDLKYNYDKENTHILNIIKDNEKLLDQEFIFDLLSAEIEMVITYFLDPKHIDTLLKFTQKSPKFKTLLSDIDKTFTTISEVEHLFPVINTVEISRDKIQDLKYFFPNITDIYLEYLDEKITESENRENYISDDDEDEYEDDKDDFPDYDHNYDEQDAIFNNTNEDEDTELDVDEDSSDNNDPKGGNRFSLTNEKKDNILPDDTGADTDIKDINFGNRLN